MKIADRYNGFKELAALRAENARLREALETALAEGLQTRAGRDAVRNALDCTTDWTRAEAENKVFELLQKGFEIAS